MTEDSAGIARITDFAYDRAGRLATLTAYTDGESGAQDTIYAYNGRGLQTNVTYEETGTVTMAYDPAGNMTKRTDEEGVVVDYLYDASNRLTERKKNGAGVNIEKFAYDGTGRLETADKGASGNPDAVSSSVFRYDDLSRVTTETQTIAEGTARVVSYSYDKGGNRTRMIHHSAATTANYSYDARERCTKIENGSTLLADYTWLGNAISKRETTCDYPGTTKPKFRTDFQRDGILRVSKVDNQHLTYDQATSGYNDLGEFAYTYDSASNPLTEAQNGAMDELDVDRTFGYDTLHRLVTALVTDTQNWTSAAQKTSWYSYDDLGNRISKQYRDAAAIGYQHDKANRMTTLAGLTQNYDKAGNQTMGYSADRGTSYVYRYDHHNRLTGVYDSTNTTRKAALTYDALGRRIEVINDPGAPGAETSRYYYDGVNEIVEYDGSGARSRYFIHGISYVDERLMMYDEDSSRPYYYTLDRMYDVRAIVDRAGAVVERYAYDPYGRPLIRESVGRGDMDDDTDMDSTDLTRVGQARTGTIWDPRADMDDDGDVDTTDSTLYLSKDNNWPPQSTSLTVAQAFSDVGNPFMFQGRPHVALDTQASDTAGKLMLNDHRARPADPVIGRWMMRDPHSYLNACGVSPNSLAHSSDSNSFYEYAASQPANFADPSGRLIILLGGNQSFGPGAAGEAQLRDIANRIATSVTVNETIGFIAGPTVPFTSSQAQRDQFKDKLKSYSPQSCKPLIVVGFSDGATVAFNVIKEEWEECLPVIDFLVMIDMVRTETWLPPNIRANAVADFENDEAFTGFLNVRQISSAAISWGDPPCLIPGLTDDWKGHLLINLGTFLGTWTLPVGAYDVDTGKIIGHIDSGCQTGILNVEGVRNNIAIEVRLGAYPEEQWN